MRFALHVILKGARVDEVLGAVDTVELTQASLVEVHLLCKQLLNLALPEVGVDLVEVFSPALRPPAFFEVGVSVVVLLPLVRTPHVSTKSHLCKSTKLVINSSSSMIQPSL